MKVNKPLLVFLDGIRVVGKLVWHTVRLKTCNSKSSADAEDLHPSEVEVKWSGYSNCISAIVIQA